MHRRKIAVLLAFAAALAAFSRAGAVLVSERYRILEGEFASVGNSEPKTGGGYRLFGTVGHVGESILTGARYTISMGVINSWRPAQADVGTAHAFPNPCNLKNGCQAVTFTRLTLKADIRIYTLSGELVRSIRKDSGIDSIAWDLKDNSGSTVASGLYFYFIKGDQASEKKGRLVIVR